MSASSASLHLRQPTLLAHPPNLFAERSLPAGGIGGLRPTHTTDPLGALDFEARDFESVLAEVADVSDIQDGPQAAAPPSRVKALLLAGLLIISIALFATWRATAGGDFASESTPTGPPTLAQVMRECQQAALAEVGPAPPTAEELRATGRGADTQFDALLEQIRYIGKFAPARNRCVASRGDYKCDEKACWPLEDPSRREIFSSTF